MTLEDFLRRLMCQTNSNRVKFTMTPDGVTEVSCFSEHIVAVMLIDVECDLTEGELYNAVEYVRSEFAREVQP